MDILNFYKLLDVTFSICVITGLNQVICGNPVRALKARRQHALTSPSAYITKPISPDGYHSPGW